MTTATAQLNVRVPAELKRGGDEVLSRFGISLSDAVRGLLGYVVSHQAPPEFLAAKAPAGESGRWADDGCGLAVLLARGSAGAGRATAGRATPSSASQSWEDERDALYDDMLDRMEQRCR